MKRARVVVADDHALTRAGVRAALADDPELELVGEAATGREAVSLARSLAPDLVLMDVRMPDTDGLEATRALKESSPLTSVLILSMFEDVELLFEAVRAGAAGYVLKAASIDKLRSAMCAVLDGEFPLDGHLTGQMLKRLASEPPRAQATSTRVLSGREQEVVRLLARGYTNKEIADALIVSPSTVKAHVEHILTKLGLSDRTQAAVWAIEAGLVRK